MTVWTTRTTNRSGEYIVIKHQLRGINYRVKGVRFRDGYAVVEKGSKTHAELKKIPLLQNAEEFELLHLRKLRFITRTADVKAVYGTDVDDPNKISDVLFGFTLILHYSGYIIALGGLFFVFRGFWIWL